MGTQEAVSTPRGPRLRTGVVVAVVAAALAVSGCGHKAKHAVGPDVRGLVLTDAETSLTKAGVGYTEHAKDAAFGIIIKANFVVCSEAYVSPHEVRLEVAKGGG